MSSLTAKVTLSELQAIRQTIEEARQEELDEASEAYIQALMSLSLTIMKKVKVSKHYAN